MTLITIQSPFLESTNIEGMSLSNVAALFHRAAAGTHVAVTNKHGEKIHYSGKTITLGFEVSQRVVMPTMELVALSSSEEEGTESESDEGECQPSSPDEALPQ